MAKTNTLLILLMDARPAQSRNHPLLINPLSHESVCSVWQLHLHIFTKISENSNLGKEVFIFVSQFQNMQLMVGWPFAHAQCIMVIGEFVKGTLMSW